MILADRWSSLDELLAAHPELRLDLGCGWVKEPGYVGLDDLRGVEGLMGQLPSDERGPDVFLDLNADAYPFADASVEEVRSRHFLEHSPHARLLAGHEVARVDHERRLAPVRPREEGAVRDDHDDAVGLEDRGRRPRDPLVQAVADEQALDVRVAVAHLRAATVELADDLE